MAVVPVLQRLRPVLLGPASTGGGLSRPGNPTKQGSDFSSLKWALNAKQKLEKELVGTGQ